MNFLDDPPARPTIAVCHDANHNGDGEPSQGCGNPECWKHKVGHSPAPRTVPVPWCQCTFCRGSRLTAHVQIIGILQGVANSIANLPKPICPNCGSEDLAKVKGCIRCLKCGFKEDCNGW